MAANAPTSQTYQSLRPYLFSVVYRMTGSASDAEDIVQDAWMHYLDAGSPAVESLRAYLTTTVSHLALDYLKSAHVQREQHIGTQLPEPVPTADAIDNPAATVEQHESLSRAILLLMEQLTPDQRVVYVLREALGLAYEAISTYVGKSAATCRQIHRRALQRIQGHQPTEAVPPNERRHLTERFMSALRRGDANDVARFLGDDSAWITDDGRKPTSRSQCDSRPGPHFAKLHRLHLEGPLRRSNTFSPHQCRRGDGGCCLAPR